MTLQIHWFRMHYNNQIGCETSKWPCVTCLSYISLEEKGEMENKAQFSLHIDSFSFSNPENGKNYGEDDTMTSPNVSTDSGFEGEVKPGFFQTSCPSPAEVVEVWRDGRPEEAQQQSTNSPRSPKKSLDDSDFNESPLEKYPIQTMAYTLTESEKFPVCAFSDNQNQELQQKVASEQLVASSVVEEHSSGWQLESVDGLHPCHQCVKASVSPSRVLSPHERSCQCWSRWENCDKSIALASPSATSCEYSYNHKTHKAHCATPSSVHTDSSNASAFNKENCCSDDEVGSGSSCKMYKSIRSYSEPSSSYTLIIKPKAMRPAAATSHRTTDYLGSFESLRTSSVSFSTYSRRNPSMPERPGSTPSQTLDNNFSETDQTERSKLPYSTPSSPAPFVLTAARKSSIKAVSLNSVCKAKVSAPTCRCQKFQRSHSAVEESNRRSVCAVKRCQSSIRSAEESCSASNSYLSQQRCSKSFDISEEKARMDQVVYLQNASGSVATQESCRKEKKNSFKVPSSTSKEKLQFAGCKPATRHLISSCLRSKKDCANSCVSAKNGDSPKGQQQKRRFSFTFPSVILNLFGLRKSAPQSKTVSSQTSPTLEYARNGGRSPCKSPYAVRALPPLPGDNLGYRHNYLEVSDNVSGSSEESDTYSCKKKMDYAASIERVRDCGWYWGPISGETAEQLLANEPDGSFVVRDSSDEHYIFSLTFKLNGLVRHVRIEHDQGNFSFGCLQKFHSNTIVDFIENAVEHSRSGRYLFFLHRRPVLGPMRVQLLHPVSRFKQVQSLQHLCRFSILRTVRRDLISTLPLPVRLKDYLDTPHYYSEELANLSQKPSHIISSHNFSSRAMDSGLNYIADMNPLPDQES